MTHSGRQRNLMMHAQCPLPVFILSGLYFALGQVWHGGTLKPGGRKLDMTCPVCLLDRQFPENILFGLAKRFMKTFPMLTVMD